MADGFLYSLTTEHLLAFAALFTLFIILIILAVWFSKKTLTSMFLQVLAMATLIAGPLYLYDLINKLVSPVEFQHVIFRKLYYEDTAVVKGFLVNKSKRTLRDCRVTARLLPKEDSLKEAKAKLVNGYHNGRTVLEGQWIPPGGMAPFRIAIPGVTYTEDLDLRLKSECR